MADIQHERAFQKQDAIFVGSKRVIKGSKKSGKVARYYRNVGLSFKTPDEAKTGTFVDKKCPFTGNVSIRGKLLKGVCVTAKMERTIIVRRDYLNFVRKYRRFEKRHKNVAAHCSPAFDCKDGDIATVGQCRPLAKTVRFNVIKIEKNQIFGSARKQFALF